MKVSRNHVSFILAITVSMFLIVLLNSCRPIVVFSGNGHENLGEGGQRVLKGELRRFLARRQAQIRVFSVFIDSLGNGLYEFEIKYAPQAKSSMTPLIKCGSKFLISGESRKDNERSLNKFLRHCDNESLTLMIDNITKRFLSGTINYSSGPIEW